MGRSRHYPAQTAALQPTGVEPPCHGIEVGWLGTDPTPDLDAFTQLVASGAIRYFILQPVLVETNTVGSNAKKISAWVNANFKERTVDGVRIYDLRQ